MDMLKQTSIGIPNVSVDGGGGRMHGGRSGGMGSGGDTLRRRCQSILMAWSLWGGDSWTPVMATVRACMATMMQLLGVIDGSGMAWCLYRKVLVSHS